MPLALRRCLYKLVVLTTASLLVAPAHADDGTWSASFSLEGGPVYSEADHPSIALDKEVLTLSMPDAAGKATTKAAFSFVNTSDGAVTVEAGFPLVAIGTVKLYPDEQEGNARLDLSDFDPTKTRTMALLDLVYPGGFQKVEEVDDPTMVPYTIDQKLLSKAPRVVVSPAALPEGLVSFSVTQDGAPLPIKEVVVEAKTEGNLADDGAMTISLVLHFRHALAFGPKATSLVVATYTMDHATGGAPAMGDYEAGYSGTLIDYAWRYVIGTGSTWKGPIGTLWVALPMTLASSLPEALAYLGDKGTSAVYQAKAFEPKKDDVLTVTYRTVAYQALDPSEPLPGQEVVMPLPALVPPEALPTLPTAPAGALDAALADPFLSAHL